MTKLRSTESSRTKDQMTARSCGRAGLKRRKYRAFESPLRTIGKGSAEDLSRSAPAAVSSPEFDFNNMSISGVMEHVKVIKRRLNELGVCVHVGEKTLYDDRNYTFELNVILVLRTLYDES